VLSGFSSGGLLLADIPNNFGSVFRATGCPPRGHCLQADLCRPETANRLAFVDHYSGLWGDENQDRRFKRSCMKRITIGAALIVLLLVGGAYLYLHQSQFQVNVPENGGIALR
jgi:hypothetical protein